MIYDPRLWWQTLTGQLDAPDPTPAKAKASIGPGHLLLAALAVIYLTR